MEHKTLKKAAKYGKEHRKKARWHKVLGGLGAVVVFCTTYALIMPAITMEHKPTCGLEEHTHDESCYETVLACGLAETEGHTHDSSCYTVETVTSTKLVCDNTDEDHVHDDSCYETVETEVKTLTCGLEEAPAHWHTADCYEQQLVCGLEEHLHDDILCYAKEDPAVEPSAGDKDEFDPEGDAEDAEDAEDVEDEEEIEDEEETAVFLQVDETYTYEENELLKVVFHVKGEVELPKNEDAGEEEAFEDAEAPEDAEEAEDAEAPEDAEEPEDAGAPQDAGPEEGPELVFTVEEREAGDEEYDAYAEAAEEDSQLMVMSYRLTYGDQELDLSQCEITAEVMPSELLLELLAEPVQTFNAGEDAENAENVMLLTAFGADQTGEVSELDSIYIGESNVMMDNGIMTLDLDEELDGTEAEAVEEAVEEAMVEDVPALGSSLTVTLDSENPTVAVSIMEQVNPSFTVQYYANLDVVAYNDPSLRKVIGSTSYTNELPVIDTTGGKLPTNGGGSTASPNGNEIRNLYVDMTTGKLQTKTELTEVYSSRDFQYYTAPSFDYMNALKDNEEYDLTEIWIGYVKLTEEEKTGTEEEQAKKIETKQQDLMKQIADKKKSIMEGDEDEATRQQKWKAWIEEWESEDNGRIITDIDAANDVHFTNRKATAEANENYILMQENTVIRFVYDTTEVDKEFDAAFYDYDIGDGMIYSTELNAQKQTGGKATSTQGSDKYYMHTKQSGINSPGNYTGSGAKLAFGNANTGSGLQHEQWYGNLLNKANQTQSGHPEVDGSYKGCTFGLVTGLVDGIVQYASGVDAPKLFNDGSAAGKTSYDNGEFSLTFNRVGDTYTLTTVNGTGTGNLDTFNHPSPNASTVHNHIWTNNFWPMDSAGSFGTDGHDMKFGDYTNREKYKFAGQAGSSGGSAAANGTFPWSDDGEDHNSYFGMYYKVDFDLVEDYVGPLEYYFFGDDDMWVFLDGKLVCDIGGVHSSVGEYVNLWDYLEKGSEESAGKHTLYFFYTERGESGSTCWMQFTLPNVSSNAPEQNPLQTTQNLKATKDVVGIDVDTKFDFRINLYVDKDSAELLDNYAYSLYFLQNVDSDDEEFSQEVDGLLKGITPDEDGTYEFTGNKLEDLIEFLNEKGYSEPENGDGLYFYSEIFGFYKQSIISDGGTFKLGNKDYIKIDYLPEGTYYTLTEIGTKDDYTLDMNLNGTDSTTNENGDQTVGNTVTGSGDNTVNVTLTNTYNYRLPETGGPGINWWYILGGAFAAAAAATLVYKKLYRREGRN